MKHAILFTLLLIGFGSTYAQNKGKIDYTPKCGLSGYPTDEADQMAKFGGDIGKYFDKHLNWKKMEKVGGLIIVDVAVDTLGHPCTVGYTNKTVNNDHEVYSLYLDDVVNHMPNWQPAMKNGKPVNNITRIGIYCAVVGHKELEVTYFRSYAQQTEKILVTPMRMKLINLDWEDLDKYQEREGRQ
ncbi:MAG: hypothetical protein EOP51_01970 [Sphingobacteriales bacterium]|nr:MAG: hypothetical protein EOP51_01970 [Sphingobacteriales bacterium]